MQAERINDRQPSLKHLFSSFAARAAYPHGRSPLYPALRPLLQARASVIASPGRSKFDNHRQINAGNDLDLVFLQKHRRDIGRCSAEHIGQQQHTIAPRNVVDRTLDLVLCHLDIVVPADRNGRNMVEIADHGLGRGNQFVRDLSVRNDHSADSLLILLFCHRSNRSDRYDDQLSLSVYLCHRWLTPHFCISRCVTVASNPFSFKPFRTLFATITERCRAAGAADADRQIRFAFALIPRQEIQQADR